MPVGVLADGLAVLVGGLAGGKLGNLLQEQMKQELTLIFGVVSIAMGISYVVRVNAMPAVVLAVILGLVLGRLAGLTRWIELAVGMILRPMGGLSQGGKDALTPEKFMEQFISAAVLFCASGTGIFGALESGMSGDHTVLLAKALLDIFTAAIFAASLGCAICAVCIPQMALMLALFYSAALILPHTTELMRADFMACGGILMLATGFRIAGIKSFPIADMLPAMILIMPLSSLWSRFADLF